MSVIIAASTISMIAPHFVAFGRAASAATELFVLIDRESEINPFDESGDKPQNPHGVIALQGIGFSYPSRPDVKVLEDFSLNVPAGKVTALVVSGTYSSKTRCVMLTVPRAQVVQAKAPSSACSSVGTTQPLALSRSMAQTSRSSICLGYVPMSALFNR
jgi:ABC-type transport system involved in cytochrome bd biosynthesis fused ATPase/permease subunit